MSLQIHPPATPTTLGLLDRWAVEVPYSPEAYLIPCPSEDFARGVAFALARIPEGWGAFAPATEAPVGVDAPQIPLPPPLPLEPVIEAPTPLPVISTPAVGIVAETPQPIGSALPPDAPPTWEEFKQLSDKRAENKLQWWCEQGWTEGGLARLWGLSPGAVSSRRVQIRARLARAAEANGEAPMPIAAPPKAEVDTPPPQQPTTSLFDLGLRGMSFADACQTLCLSPSQARHREWKEGQTQRYQESRK